MQTLLENLGSYSIQYNFVLEHFNQLKKKAQCSLFNFCVLWWFFMSWNHNHLSDCFIISISEVCFTFTASSKGCALLNIHVLYNCFQDKFLGIKLISRFCWEVSKRGMRKCWKLQNATQVHPASLHWSFFWRYALERNKKATLKFTELVSQRT